MTKWIYRLNFGPSWSYKIEWVYRLDFGPTSLIGPTRLSGSTNLIVVVQLSTSLEFLLRYFTYAC